MRGTTNDATPGDQLIDAERSAPEPGDAVRARLLARIRATAVSTQRDGDEPGGSDASAEAGAQGVARASQWSALGKYLLVAIGAFAAGVAVDRAVVRRGSTPPAARGDVSSAPAVEARGASRARDAGGRSDGDIRDRSERDTLGGARAAAVPVAFVVDAGAPISHARRADGTIDAARPASADHASSNASANASSAASLESERSALDVARTAVLRHNAAAAIDALERLERSHPVARLVDERELLWVQSLAMAGRRAEARERAARFLSAHPESIVRSAVEHAVPETP